MRDMWTKWQLNWISCQCFGFPLSIVIPPTLHDQFRLSTTLITGDRDSSVGLTTGYGMDGPGIESRCGPDFRYPSRPALGLGVNHPFPSSADVKERVELYLYSTSGLSWPVIGRPLPLPYTTLITRASRWSLVTVNTTQCSFGYQIAMDWQTLLHSILYSREYIYFFFGGGGGSSARIQKY
jgi:hypothetical protein